MNKKKWTLLLFLIVIAVVSVKLFYKTYQVNTVAQSADKVIVIDRKKIANTLLWNTITTPAQWNFKALFSPVKKDTTWMDMVSLPDYIFLFHCKDQPEHIYYAAMEINNEEDFEKAVHKYHFEKKQSTPYQQYYSAETGAGIIKNGNYILAGFIQSAEFNFLSQTATELFQSKKYLLKQSMEKVIAAKSHAAFWIKQNDFLEQDAVISGNFNKEQISLNGIFLPNKSYVFEQAEFNVTDSSLAEAGLVKPAGNTWQVLPQALKNGLSNAFAGDADSLLTGKHNILQISIASAQPKIDSAITYSYDDDFNKIEKVVVNNILEPSLQICIKGDGIGKLYDHWKTNQKLEATPGGELLVLMPFVKSYATVKSTTELQVTSYNYKDQVTKHPVKCVAFCNINFNKVPGELKKYLPESIIPLLKNIATIQLLIDVKNSNLHAVLSLKKNNNDLPVIDF